MTDCGFPSFWNFRVGLFKNGWMVVLVFSYQHKTNGESMPLPIKVKLNPCIITTRGLGGTSHWRIVIYWRLFKHSSHINQASFETLFNDQVPLYSRSGNGWLTSSKSKDPKLHREWMSKLQVEDSIGSASFSPKCNKMFICYSQSDLNKSMNKDQNETSCTSDKKK